MSKQTLGNRCFARVLPATFVGDPTKVPDQQATEDDGCWRENGNPQDFGIGTLEPIPVHWNHLIG